MTADLSEHFARILAAPVFGHLATVRHHGSVQVNPMWFEFDGDAGVIRFTHTTKRAKYRNLQRNPHMTLEALDPENPLRYVEVRGRLAEIEPDPEGAFYVHLAEALRRGRPARARRQGRPGHPRDADREDRGPLSARVADDAPSGGCAGGPDPRIVG